MKTGRLIPTMAACVLLALFSAESSASIMFEDDFGGFDNSGSLYISFEGDPGADNMLVDSEVTDFSATYTDDGTVGTIGWSGLAPLGDLAGLLFDASGGGQLMTLSALSANFPPTFPPPPTFLLSFGTAEAASRGNLIEIFQIDPFQGDTLLASAPLTAGDVPLPPTILLFVLGLLLLRRAGR
jgi:hypothetical protein